MPQFSPEEFMVEPTIKNFNSLRKDDLVALGKHLGLEIRSTLKKREIYDLIKEHFVKEKTFEQSVFIEQSIDTSENSGKSEKDRQWQREHEKILWEREREKREWEREREEKEREFRLREQELELKKLELQVQANAQSPIVSSGQKFDVTKHVRMVPPFQEREVDQYFLHFEKIATNCGWPKDSWTMLLQSVLVGKAREIYSQLSIELSANYDTVKELILNGYELVPEAYRQKFRNFEKTDHKTYVQFAQVKEQLFDRWCLSEKIDKQYKNLRELILIEEFKRCINPDVRTFINEQKPDSFIAAARLADDFALTHKNTFENKSQTFKPPNNFDNRHTSARKYPHDNRGKFNDPRTSRDTNNLNWRRPAQNFQPNKPSDCVGPLPKTKRGNQYLLTVMCVSTRFPEAIPLRNIKAKTIVQALTKFFTLVGLPKSIQSDQGSNFMSGLFQQVMHKLGITQYNSSAYHPESQGALERFHQTLKQMIKTYCFETEKDWDDGVHLLLFAVRESVQESLGFSPFELVFGHTVRGPLKLLKEKLLTDDGGLLNLFRYVTDFRTKLTKACELARKNLKTAQNRMKHSYDKNTVTRNFQNGDKVLALLPVPGNPLQARYFGPYVIEKKENDLNYVIITPNRRRNRQLCHVNMLKAYHERKKVAQPVNVVSSDRDSHNDQNEFELSNLSETTKLSNSDVLRNMDSKLSHLKPSQRQDVLDLVHEYAQLFPDVPSRTDMISHDVDVGDAPPIKQHPYRLNPTKAAYLDQEIQYLLDNDFIEPSQSSWSSPCILVPKPDGSYRMCTDYRKVNNLTKSDNFPIPRIDDCVDKIGNAKYVSKFDLLKGFWQIPLSERAKEISAFVTPRGLYQYKVMPFGMRNSPATFQRLINRIISQIDGCEGYIDDVIIYSDTWEEHLEILRKFFKRLSEAKLTINLVKSEFGCGHVTYLGHIVGQGQVKPVNAKVEAIADFPQPTTKKHVMRLLGMAGY